MKVGIITIIDNNNYGNRLQNYAVQEIIKKENIEVETIRNLAKPMEKYRKIYRIDIIIAKILKKIKYQLFEKKNDEKRKKAFTNFTKKYITNTDFVIKPDENKKDLNDKYDYFIVGSDQVWTSSVTAKPAS